MKKQVIASILAVAAISSCAFAAVACTNESTNSVTQAVQPMAETGLQIEQTRSRGIALSAEPLSTVFETGTWGGKTYVKENYYRFTATITPSNATNTEVDWRVEWSDPTSETAQKYAISNFLKITPSSDGSLTATVSFLQRLTAQAKVIVTLRENSAISAEATVDSIKRCTGFSKVILGSSTLANGKFTNTSSYKTVTGTELGNGLRNYATFGNGSVACDWVYTATFEPSEECITAMTTAGFEFEGGRELEYTGNLALNALLNPSEIVGGSEETKFNAVLRELGEGTEIGEIFIVAMSQQVNYTLMLQYPVVLGSDFSEVSATGITIGAPAIVY